MHGGNGILPFGEQGVTLVLHGGYRQAADAYPALLLLEGRDRELCVLGGFVEKIPLHGCPNHTLQGIVGQNQFTLGKLGLQLSQILFGNGRCQSAVLLGTCLPCALLQLPGKGGKFLGNQFHNNTSFLNGC